MNAHLQQLFALLLLICAGGCSPTLLTRISLTCLPGDGTGPLREAAHCSPNKNGFIAIGETVATRWNLHEERVDNYNSAYHGAVRAWSHPAFAVRVNLGFSGDQAYFTIAERGRKTSAPEAARFIEELSARLKDRFGPDQIALSKVVFY